MSLTASLYIEAVEGKGEDAPPLLLSNAAAVFDGLGGAGAAPLHLADGRTVTNAYAGSRVARSALLRTLQDMGGEQARWADWQPAELAQRAGAALVGALDAYHASLGRPRSPLSSALVLPTTMACALIDEEPGGAAQLTALWAGDSRVYVLDGDGVHQVSRDDQADDRDYRAQLQMDAPMTNKVNLSAPFHVNARRVALRTPCAVVTCSDGCCMYFGQPLRLEYRWLAAFGKAQHPDEAAALLRDYYEKTSQDDCSLTVHVLADGYEQFREMIAARRAAFAQQYGEAMAGGAALGQARAALAEADRALRDAEAASAQARAALHDACAQAARTAWIETIDVWGGAARRPDPRDRLPAGWHGCSGERAARALRAAERLGRCNDWLAHGGSMDGGVPGDAGVSSGRAPQGFEQVERAEAELRAARVARDRAVAALDEQSEKARRELDRAWAAYKPGYECYFGEPAVRVAQQPPTAGARGVRAPGVAPVRNSAEAPAPTVRAREAVRTPAPTCPTEPADRAGGDAESPAPESAVSPTPVGVPGERAGEPTPAPDPAGPIGPAAPVSPDPAPAPVCVPAAAVPFVRASVSVRLSTPGHIAPSAPFVPDPASPYARPTRRFPWSR